MAIQLTKVDFRKSLLRDGVILPSSHGELVDTSLMNVAKCLEGFFLLTNSRDLAATYPGAPRENVGRAIQIARRNGDKVLEAAALMEMAIYCHTWTESMQYLYAARDVAQYDILSIQEELTERFARQQQAAAALVSVSVASAKANAPKKPKLACQKEFDEIAELKRLAQNRASTAVLLDPRYELLELIEENIEQFILREKSEFLRNRRSVIAGMFVSRNWRGAENMARSSAIVAEQTLGHGHWWVAICNIEIATALLRQGKIESARELLPSTEQIFLDWVPDPATSVFKQEWDLLQAAISDLKIYDD